MPFPTQMPGLDSLVQTFGVYNPETYDKARQTFDLASQFNQGVNKAQQQDYEQNAVMNPLKVRQQELENTGKDLNNEDQTYKNWNSNRDVQVRNKIPLDTEYQAKISDFAKKMSDNDMAQLENKIQRDALSTDPEVRKTALQQMSNFKDLVKAREQHRMQAESHIEGIRMQTASQERINQANIDAGRWDRKGGGKTIQDLRTKLQVEGDPQKRDALIRGGLAQAQLEGDTGAAAYFQGLFDANAPALATANTVKTAPTAARPDLNKMGVTTVAPPVVPPTVPVGNASATPSAAPKHSLADLKKMYPGKSDADLKAAYKAKFGVDLK